MSRMTQGNIRTIVDCDGHRSRAHVVGFLQDLANHDCVGSIVAGEDRHEHLCPPSVRNGS
jgi:hypothetical protein